MEFSFFYLAYLVISAFALIEVSINVRKNIVLKTYLLLILSSVFLMNFLTYITVSNRLEFILIKFSRLIYVCSSILTLSYLVIAKTPKWILVTMFLGGGFFFGLRLYNFSQLAYESNDAFSNQIFSMSSEIKSPIASLKYIGALFAALGAGIAYFYYRKFFMKINSEDGPSRKLSFWMISFVLPLFLLIIFTVFGLMKVLPERIAPYLFCLFSAMVIFSVLYRPKFLNNSNQSSVDRNIFKKKPLANLN